MYNQFMQKLDESEIEKRLSGFPLVLRYLGPSLRQRMNRRDWYENRFIFDIFTDLSFITRHETLFKGAALENILNCDQIFSTLNGGEQEYDLKIFDVIAEVRLANWAKDNEYVKIEKLTLTGRATPDFKIHRGEECSIAEAKHFRGRDYLIDFVADRLKGLLLILNRLTETGFKIYTTAMYKERRPEIVKSRSKERVRWIDEIRSRLNEDSLTEFIDGDAEEFSILDGLITIAKKDYVGEMGVEFDGPPDISPQDMLERLKEKVNEAVSQIADYIKSSDKCTCNNAIVFVSGIDHSDPDWDVMWVAMKDPSNDIWGAIKLIRRELGKMLFIPLQMIVGMGNPIVYRPFPWEFKELNL